MKVGLGGLRVWHVIGIGKLVFNCVFIQKENIKPIMIYSGVRLEPRSSSSEFIKIRIMIK